MRKIIIVLSILCLSVVNVCYAQSEKPEAWELLLGLGLTAVGTYGLVTAIVPGSEELSGTERTLRGVFSGLLLLCGVGALIDFSVKLGRARLRAEVIQKNERTFLMANIYF